MQQMQQAAQAAAATAAASTGTAVDPKRSFANRKAMDGSVSRSIDTARDLFETLYLDDERLANANLLS